MASYRGQVRDFVYVTDQAYTRDDILDCEVRGHGPRVHEDCLRPRSATRSSRRSWRSEEYLRGPRLVSDHRETARHVSAARLR